MTSHNIPRALRHLALPTLACAAALCSAACVRHESSAALVLGSTPPDIIASSTSDGLTLQRGGIVSVNLSAYAQTLRVVRSDESEVIDPAHLRLYSGDPSILEAIAYSDGVYALVARSEGATSIRVVGDAGVQYERFVVDVVP